MLKDPTEFRERFLRWKKGELVYENGLALPAYEDGLTPHKKSEVNTNLATYNPEEDLYISRYTIPEVTITGDKSKRVYRSHAPRTSGMSKNYQKWDTADLLSAMATGSDVGDAVDIGKDLYNQNYTSAGIGTAMLAIPNVVEKPVKSVAKPISKYLKNFNYLDTTSKLNKNIRTALANDRNPYGYNLYNPNNVLPFVKGTLNTIAGKSIKLKNIADIPIENRNRHIAWRKYLGLKSDDDLIDPFTHLVYGPYVENKRGLFNVATKDDKTKKALNDQFVYSLLNNKGKFLKDGALQNHGTMGYSILKTNDAEYPAVLHYYDTWDLQPFNSMTLLPKSIRNFEVSKMIPGAKPFTLDGYAKMSKSLYDEYLNAVNTKEGWNKLVPNHYGGNMPLLVPAAAGLGLAATPFAIDMGEDVINWVDEKIKSWSNETGHQR